MPSDPGRPPWPLPRLGWLWVPAVFLLVVLAVRVSQSWLWHILLESGIRWPWEGVREVLDLGWAGSGIVGLALLVGFAPLEILSRRRRLAMVYPLLPAWLLPLGLGTLWVLRELRAGGRYLEDLEDLAHDLGPGGIAGVTVVLLVFGMIPTLVHGRRTKCPACGAWWGEELDSRTTGDSTESTGGRFAADGSGWEQTRTRSWTEEQCFRCRKCAHEWTGAFVVRQREHRKPTSVFWKTGRR